MRKFIRNIILFSLVPLLVIITDLFLPYNFFTYRISEAIAFKYTQLANGIYYPNRKMEMTEQGDLGYYTKYAIEKKIVWKTDQLGFRNDHYIKSPDIVLIGDSFFAGIALSQEETVVNQVRQKLNDSADSSTVYNIAPGSFDRFDALLKKGLLKKPKLVVYSIVERNIPELSVSKPISFPETSNLFYSLFQYLPGNAAITTDQVLKMDYIEYCKARISDQKGSGIPSPNNPKMLFFRGKDAEINTADSTLFNAIKVISRYKSYCDSLGVAFLFVPIPNKETVYFEMVPFNHQPSFLFRLDSLCNAVHISTIQTLNLFNEAKKRGILLYHYDDTHWNASGASLVAAEITSRSQKELAKRKSGR